MMFLPAFRLATLPLPPGFFAARFLAAAIRPPLLFFIVQPPVSAMVDRSSTSSVCRSHTCLLYRFRFRINIQFPRDEQRQQLPDEVRPHRGQVVALADV